MFPPNDVLKERQPLDLGQYLVWLIALALIGGLYYVWSHPAPRRGLPDLAQANRLAPVGAVSVAAPTPPPAAPTPLPAVAEQPQAKAEPVAPVEPAKIEPKAPPAAAVVQAPAPSPVHQEVRSPPLR